MLLLCVGCVLYIVSLLLYGVAWCLLLAGGVGLGESLLSTKATRRPVRPPTRPSAPDTPLAALAIAGPAVEATRDRPCVALEAAAEACAAACLADSAAFCVVVLAVDSKRAMVRPTVRPDRLMTRAKDILCVWVCGCMGVCWVSKLLESGFLGEGKGRLSFGSQMRIPEGGAENRGFGTAEEQLMDGGRGWELGSAKRTISRTLGRGTGWAGDREKLDNSRSERRWLLARFLGKKAANQRA